MSKFLDDICRAVGHEWEKDPNLFADVCSRCGAMFSWMDKAGSLKKIADAMSLPLKTAMDYKSVIDTLDARTQKGFKEDLIPGDLPVYDEDLPSENPPA